MDQNQCQHCGALLPPPQSSPWVCQYCGAAQPEPQTADGCVLLTDDHVLDHLRQEVTGLDSTWLHPSIPDKKVNNVRKLHAAHLPADERVLGLYDGTAFGSAKDGFFVTSRRLCWKNQMEPACFLEWGQVDPDEIWVDGNKLMVGKAKLETLYSKKDGALYAWQEVLCTLAISAHPDRQQEHEEDEDDDGSPREADPGWGGPEVAVAATGAAWGGTGGAAPVSTAVPQGAPVAPAPDIPDESFPRAPYDHDGSGCSLVDVHPAGGMVAAVTSNTVVLRYTNGQRFLAIEPPDGVLDTAFSPDGNWLLVAGMDNRTNLYEVNTGQHRGATPEMEDYCDQVVWLGPGRFAAASQSSEVWIVDSSTMQQSLRLLGPDPNYGQLGGMAATPDGSRLFLSVDNRLGAFDTATGKILWRADEALTNSSRITVSPDGTALLAAGYDGVAFFDAQTGQAGARFPFACAQNVTWPEGGGGLLGGGKELNYYSWSPRPCFSPTGHSIAVQDHVGNLNFIDPATGALYPTPRAQGCAWIEDLAWFPDSSYLMVGMSDGTIAFWSVQPMACTLHCAAEG